MSFESFELDSALLAGVRDMGFTEPTDIQGDAIPWALEGRDLLACAMTGSGKTAAFALPILQRLLHRRRGVTRALVLSPTRELALQSEQHFRELGAHTEMKVASIFGGVGYEPQERAFREGYDVLVATPGRLLDHLRRPYANLDHLEVLVLDEADRMLDMGFIPDVRRILQHVPRERQTLLFSATLATPIVRLAGDMLHDPVTINLERRSAPAEGVRQAVYPVRHELKPALLLHLLRRHDVESALVFTRTKERADLVGEYLRRAGISVAVIHGDRTQKHRTRVMEGFKEGRYEVLVATDVAARGIDIEELSHVINLDVPNQPDDYIHRVGRTARAGSTGDAFTFVAARELADLHLIEKTIGQKLERIRLDDFDYSPTSAQAVMPPPPPAEALPEDEAAVADDGEVPDDEAATEAEAADRDDEAEEEAAPPRGRRAGRGGERTGGRSKRAARADETEDEEPRRASSPRSRASAQDRDREHGRDRERGRGRGRGRGEGRSSGNTDSRSRAASGGASDAGGEVESSIARFAALRARRSGRPAPALEEERGAWDGPSESERRDEPRRSEQRSEGKGGRGGGQGKGAQRQGKRGGGRPAEDRGGRGAGERRERSRDEEPKRRQPAAREPREQEAAEQDPAVARFARLRKRHRSGRR